ncbi:MAG: hypothetical protein Q9222_006942 [Ikaeria aurantiellina]
MACSYGRRVVSHSGRAAHITTADPARTREEMDLDSMRHVPINLQTLPALSLVAFLLVCVALWARNAFFHPLARIPGPFWAKFTSIWHIYHSWKGDECTLIQEYHKKYGKFVRLGPNNIDIADGAALGPIYVDKGGFLKASAYHNFYLNGHATIFSTSDPSYRSPRAKVVAPLFSNSAIRKDRCLEDCVDRFIRRLDKDKLASKGSPIDVQEHTRALGFDVLTSYLFRHPYPTIVDNTSEGSMIPWLNAFVDLGQSFDFPARFFSMWLPFFERTRPRKDLESKSTAAVDDHMKRLIADSAEKGDSYQGKLLQSGFPEEQVIAECMDAAFAGTHSSGAVLATTLWYLAKHGHAYDRLREEVVQHQADDVDIHQLPYLQGVVKEGLRLAPVNTRLPRVVPEDGWHFDGQFFPAGTTVAVASTQLFFNENTFPDPMAFQPERWLKPSAEMQRDFVPFSVGIRQCIARNLAMHELLMAVKKVAEADMMRSLRPVQDSIEVYEWFNTAIKGNKVEVAWCEEADG